LRRRAGPRLVETEVTEPGRWGAASYLLAVAWVTAAAGYLGPWVQQPAAGLALSGVDLGEFVKFLPGVRNGSLVLTRQMLYAPAVAVAIGIALLAGARVLRWGRGARAVMLLLALLVSGQLLPPAWSPAALLTAEFRGQTIALVLCWVLLAGCPVWRALPLRVAAFLAALVSAAAAGLSAWQFMLTKPSIDGVYHAAVPIGWGFVLCMVGLIAVTAVCAMLACQRQRHEI